MLDLSRYCDPHASRGITDHPWALEFQGKLWSFGTDGHVMVLVPGRKLPGGEPTPMLPEGSKNTAYIRGFLAPAPDTHTAPLAALREWAGSPDWPKPPTADCKLCRGTGEGRCIFRERSRERECPHCRHAEDCVDGRFPCDCCNDPNQEIEPGRLGPLVVNRMLLARVLEAFQGQTVRLRIVPWEDLRSVPPIRLTDGERIALLMPVRDDSDVVITGFEPEPLEGAPR